MLGARVWTIKAILIQVYNVVSVWALQAAQPF